MQLDKDTLELIAVCFGFGLFCIWMGLRKHKKLKIVEDHPTVKIETAAQGFSEVQGFAWPSTPSPKCFKGIEMIYHSLQLQKKVTEGSGKNKRTTWRTVYSTGFSQPFYMMDATGLALVDPGSGELEIESKTTRSWGFLKPTEKKYYLDHFIKGSVLGFPPSEVLWGLFSSSFRLVESRINTGSPIYIKGNFQTPDSMKKEVQLSGMAKFANQVFDFQSRKIRQIKSLLDANKDDRVSSQEAIEGYSRLAMHAKTQSEAGTSPVADRPFPIHGFFTTNEDHKLFIADCHEEQLVRKLKLHFYGYLTSGVGLCLVGVITLSPRLLQKPDLAVASQTPAAIDTAVQHRSCLSGELSACQQMLKLPLTEEYLSLYRKKACELGDVLYCK